MVFHLGNASNHATKQKIKHLNKRSVSFINLPSGVPKSPDSAPMDFGMWGNLNRSLKSSKFEALAELKKFLRTIG